MMDNTKKGKDRGPRAYLPKGLRGFLKERMKVPALTYQRNQSAFLFKIHYLGGIVQHHD